MNKFKVTKFLVVSTLLLMTSGTSGISDVMIKDGNVFELNSANFVDDNFYECIVDTYNTNNGTTHDYTYELTDAELATITALDCEISDYADPIDKINEVNNLRKLTGLTSLNLYGNNISVIDLSGNLSLTELDLANNNLSAIDVSMLTNLTDLTLYSNNLSSINLEYNTALTYLDLDDNPLTTIDLSTLVNLTDLYISTDTLTTIDTSNNTNLILLEVGAGTFDLTNNTALEHLSIDNDVLTTYDFSSLTNLIELNLYMPGLTNLDLTTLGNLEILTLFSELDSIDLSGNPLLTDIMFFEVGLTSVDLTNNTALKNISIISTPLTSLDLSNNTNLEDVMILDSDLSSLLLPSSTTLEFLNVGFSNLTSVDVSTLPNLITLSMYANLLTSIDVSNNIALKRLEINGSEISELDLSKNVNLERLTISDTNIENVDLSANPLINSLVINKSKLNFRSFYYIGDKLEFNDGVTLPSTVSSLGLDLYYENQLVDINNHVFDEAGYYELELITNQSSIVQNNTFINGSLYDVFVVEATSSKYDMTADTISVPKGTTSEEILANVNLNYGLARIENNKLIISGDGTDIKEFDIIGETVDNAIGVENPETGVTEFIAPSILVLCIVCFIGYRLKNKNYISRV